MRSRLSYLLPIIMFLLVTALGVLGSFGQSIQLGGTLGMFTGYVDSVELSEVMEIEPGDFIEAKDKQYKVVNNTNAPTYHTYKVKLVYMDSNQVVHIVHSISSDMVTPANTTDTITIPAVYTTIPDPLEIFHASYKIEGFYDSARTDRWGLVQGSVDFVANGSEEQ